MNLTEANQHIRNAWTAAGVWAQLVLFLYLIRLKGVPMPDVDPSNLIAVVVIAVLAFGLYRRSRTCAVLLLGCFVLVRIWSWVAFGRVCYPVLALVLGYLFFQAVRGTFLYHKVAPSAGSGEKVTFAGLSSLFSRWRRRHSQPTADLVSAPGQTDSAPATHPALPPESTSALTDEERRGRRLLIIVFAVVVVLHVLPAEMRSFKEGLAAYRLQGLVRLACLLALFYAIWRGKVWARLLTAALFGLSPIIFLPLILLTQAVPPSAMPGLVIMTLAGWLVFAPVAYVLAFSRPVTAFMSYQKSPPALSVENYARKLGEMSIAYVTEHFKPEDRQAVWKYVHPRLLAKAQEHLTQRGHFREFRSDSVLTEESALYARQNLLSSASTP